MNKITKLLFVANICFMHLCAMGNVPNCPSDATTTKTQCEEVPGCVYTMNGCAPCTTNKYYDSSTKTCKSCDTDYTSAAGSINGESDCKKTCGNKSNFANGTWTPDDTTVSQPNNCDYTNANNITCEANYYRDGDACQSCPTTHPNSALGSTSINNCYKNCAKDVENGTATPEDNTIYYPKPNKCTYTISCDAGYYKDNNICKQCPYGTTSATNDNDDICRCFFAANTVIKDKNGGDGFKLPAKAYISSTLAGKNCSQTKS